MEEPVRGVKLVGLEPMEDKEAGGRLGAEGGGTGTSPQPSPYRRVSRKNSDFLSGEDATEELSPSPASFSKRHSRKSSYSGSPRPGLSPRVQDVKEEKLRARIASYKISQEDDKRARQELSVRCAELTQSLTEMRRAAGLEEKAAVERALRELLASVQEKVAATVPSDEPTSPTLNLQQPNGSPFGQAARRRSSARLGASVGKRGSVSPNVNKPLTPSAADGAAQAFSVQQERTSMGRAKVMLILKEAVEERCAALDAEQTALIVQIAEDTSAQEAGQDAPMPESPVSPGGTVSGSGDITLLRRKVAVLSQKVKAMSLESASIHDQFVSTKKRLQQTQTETDHWRGEASDLLREREALKATLRAVVQKAASVRDLLHTLREWRRVIRWQVRYLAHSAPGKAWIRVRNYLFTRECERQESLRMWSHDTVGQQQQQQQEKKKTAGSPTADNPGLTAALLRELEGARKTLAAYRNRAADGEAQNLRRRVLALQRHQEELEERGRALEEEARDAQTTGLRARIAGALSSLGDGFEGSFRLGMSTNTNPFERGVLALRGNNDLLRHGSGASADWSPLAAQRGSGMMSFRNPSPKEYHEQDAASVGPTSPKARQGRLRAIGSMIQRLNVSGGNQTEDIVSPHPSSPLNRAQSRANFGTRAEREREVKKKEEEPDSGLTRQEVDELVDVVVMLKDKINKMKSKSAETRAQLTRLRAWQKQELEERADRDRMRKQEKERLQKVTGGNEQPGLSGGGAAQVARLRNHLRLKELECEELHVSLEQSKMDNKRISDRYEKRTDELRRDNLRLAQEHLQERAKVLTLIDKQLEDRQELQSATRVQEEKRTQHEQMREITEELAKRVELLADEIQAGQLREQQERNRADEAQERAAILEMQMEEIDAGGGARMRSPEIKSGPGSDWQEMEVSRLRDKVLRMGKQLRLQERAVDDEKRKSMELGLRIETLVQSLESVRRDNTRLNTRCTRAERRLAGEDVSPHGSPHGSPRGSIAPTRRASNAMVVAGAVEQLQIMALPPTEAAKKRESKDVNDKMDDKDKTNEKTAEGENEGKEGEKPYEDVNPSSPVVVDLKMRADMAEGQAGLLKERLRAAENAASDAVARQREAESKVHQITARLAVSEESLVRVRDRSERAEGQALALEEKVQELTWLRLSGKDPVGEVAEQIKAEKKELAALRARVKELESTSEERAAVVAQQAEEAKQEEEEEERRRASSMPQTQVMAELLRKLTDDVRTAKRERDAAKASLDEEMRKHQMAKDVYAALESPGGARQRRVLEELERKVDEERIESAILRERIEELEEIVSRVEDMKSSPAGSVIDGESPTVKRQETEEPRPVPRRSTVGGVSVWDFADTLATLDKKLLEAEKARAAAEAKAKDATKLAEELEADLMAAWTAAAKGKPIQVGRKRLMSGVMVDAQTQTAAPP
eukprot:Hpha_TRINITY_DN16467_c4_g5::TRINITY_DN16467_c4_g5_i1::g.160857::m.160857